ncbi:NAD-dependent epimerase/dehydratase family protein [Micromonospora sp. NPDC003776]
MRVLLFGGSGFIGRHVRVALAPYADLVCPDRRECDLVGIGVARLAALVRDVRPDAVVNCAGRSAGSGYEMVGAQTMVTAKLVEAVAAGAPDARLVRLGSAAEYGVVPPGVAVREDHPAVPISEYGVSQLAGTRLAELAGATGRVDAVVLRVFNPVGPGSPRTSALGRAAMLLRQALARGEGHVAMGLLDSYRDFVDVRDVASAVRAAVLAAALSERVFNVGSGRAVPTRHAVRLLAHVAGFTGELRDGEFSPTATRSAAVPWMCADVSRAARAFGWAPGYDLPDSLKALWADVR